MAKLGEPYRLFLGEIDLGSLQIQSHTSSNLIILTTGDRHISIYDVRQSQPQNSWTIMSGHLLTCSAVINPTDDSYAVVMDNKIIRAWDKNKTSINKSKKTTLSKAIHCLLTRGRLQPLVVFSDGGLAWLNSVEDQLCIPCLAKGEQIAWVDAIATKESEMLVMIVSRKEGEKPEMTVWVFTVREDTQSVVGQQLEGSVKWTPSCTSLRLTGSQVTLLSMDTMGHLTETQLTGSSFGKSIQLHTVPLATTICTICALGANHLAVCGVRSSTGKPCFGIWDTKFGILQTSKPLPGPLAETPLYLHQRGNRIALACKSGMYTYTYMCMQSTLGSALGKFSATCSIVPQDPKLNKISEILTKLADTEQTKSRKAFNAMFSQLDTELGAMDKTTRYPLLGVQSHIVAVIERMLNEKKFSPREELHILIKRRLIPISIVSTLMKWLTSHEDLALIKSCLTTVSNIPESALINCLSYILRTDNNKFQECRIRSKKHMDEVPSDCPFDKTKVAFIRLLLSLPFNEIFLEGQLKELDFQSCLDLLQYLQYILTSNDVQENIADTKIIDWMNMLLDAHFTQMVLSAEARTLLVNLHQTVGQEVGIHNELIGLESILSQIKEKCDPLRKEYAGHYNIHVLHVF